MELSTPKLVHQPYSLHMRTLEKPNMEVFEAYFWVAVSFITVAKLRTYRPILTLTSARI